MTVTTRTITGILVDPAGSALTTGKVTIKLVGDGKHKRDAYVTATGEAVTSEIVLTNGTGTTPLACTDLLTPTGLVWMRTVRPARGAEWSDCASVLSTTADNSTWFSRLTDPPGAVAQTALAALDVRVTTLEADDAGDDTAIALVQTHLDTEAATRAAADTAEATARAAADTTNATAIATETTRATTAEGLLAPIASPTFTGHPVGVTESAGNNSTRLATTAFTTAAIAAQAVTDTGTYATIASVDLAFDAVGVVDDRVDTLTTTVDGKQPLDTDLTAIAALVSAANKIAYATGSGTWSLADLSAFARTILDDADAATALATLGAAVLPDVQVFAASGTWNKPSGNYKSCRIFGIGGGAGAGSGRKGAAGTVRCGGGGGSAAGGFLIEAQFSSMPVSAVVTIGAGGTGGAAVTGADTNGNAGTAGGNTTIVLSASVTLAAIGGNAGGGGTNAAGTAGSSSATGQPIIGTAGGSASATGAGGGSAGNPGRADAGAGPCATGGGAGGGITTGDVFSSGGGAGYNAYLKIAGVAGGGTDGAVGPSAPTLLTGMMAGNFGGGGGASSVLTNAGAGAAGGFPGGGGGGGGAAVNAVGNSGKGGDGGAGVLIVVCY